MAPGIIYISPNDQIMAPGTIYISPSDQSMAPEIMNFKGLLV